MFSLNLFYHELRFCVLFPPLAHFYYTFVYLGIILFVNLNRHYSHFYIFSPSVIIDEFLFDPVHIFLKFSVNFRNLRFLCTFDF